MKKKILAAALAAVLCVGVGVGGTLAWLTDDTQVVTNTFTIGDINIELTESTGTNYTIVPGGTQAKDPKITVATPSEECYVYVSITNDVKVGDTVVATPNISGDWTAIQTNGNETVYRYKEIVNAGTSAVELPVFTQVSYSDTITKADIGTLSNKTIVLSGFAHQSDNTTQAVADEAALAYFFPA